MIKKEEYLLEQYKMFRKESVNIVNRMQTVIVYFLIGIIAGEAFVIHEDKLLLLLAFNLVYIGWFAFIYIVILDTQTIALYFLTIAFSIRL